MASFITILPAIEPGAVISMASEDTSPFRVEAAAVSTHGPPAGEPMVPGFGPSLPAATTVNTPALVAAINARSSGAVMRSNELPTE